MNTAAADPRRFYVQPLVGRIDGALRHCLLGAAALGVLVLLAVFLAPAPPLRELTLEAMPERYAKLILEPPKPRVAPPAPTETVAVMEMPEQPPVAAPAPATPAEPAPVVRPKPNPRRRAAPQPTVAPDQGAAGRRRAEQDVKAEVAKVTDSLDKALDQLAVALPAAGSGDEAAANRRPARRRRGTRGGRTGDQVASAAGVSDLMNADLGGTDLTGRGVAVAGIADLDFTGDDGGGSVAGGGAAGAGGRSSDSLLAVVRRYAPGIQFCYENELKRHATLRGKLVVSLTVQADGSVSDVVVVENTLGSDAVVGCAVAQMQGWQFPAIADGVSTFKAPFVFTPPDS
jgi:outer membrane biosynthesis protein TonB